MSLSLSDLDYLTSASGQGLVSELRASDLSEQNALNLVTQLRKTYSADAVRAGMYLVRLRNRAESKFGERAHTMYFTEHALQQASDPLISHYRASRMAGQQVLDMCCGIGGDLLGFGETGIVAQGIDLDPVRVAMARLNTKEYDHVSVEIGDATEPVTLKDTAIFFDPARRNSAGRRIYDVQKYNPPLDTLLKWHVPQIVAKLSPGVDKDQLADYPGSIEFISVSGELKEAVLWYKSEEPRYAATLLHDGAIHHWRTNQPQAVDLSAPLGWLVEPDPSIIRAGLVQDIAATYQGRMLDETIAYFTTAEFPDSVWLRAWRIHAWMPFHLKRLRAYLRERHVGRVTVKKRGSPLTPETLTPKLKLNGENAATLVLTQHNEQPIVLICDEMPGNS